MATTSAVRDETKGAASPPKSNWNPFAPFTVQRAAQPAESCAPAAEPDPKQPIVTEQPTSDAERRRIARAWNGLPL